MQLVAKELYETSPSLSVWGPEPAFSEFNRRMLGRNST